MVILNFYNRKVDGDVGFFYLTWPRHPFDAVVEDDVVVVDGLVDVVDCRLVETIADDVRNLFIYKNWLHKQIAPSSLFRPQAV